MKNDSSTNISSTERIDILQRLDEENFTKLIPTAFILTMLAVLGTIGNSLSIYIFTTRMRRNVQNDLFKLLCVVNVLACAVCIPGDIVNLRYQYLYPSEVACKLLKFLNMYTMAVSVFTLQTLAIYRLRAASPAKMVNSTLTRLANPRRNNIAIGIAAILVISACMCWIGIVVFGMRTNTTSIPGVKGQDCSVADDVQNTAWPFVFNAMLVLGFTTLIIITIYAYYKIWRTVKKSRMAIVAHSMIAASPARTAFKNFNNGAPLTARGTGVGLKTDKMSSNRVRDGLECSNSFSSADRIRNGRIAAQASSGEKSLTNISFPGRTASKMPIARYTEVTKTLTAPIIDTSDHFSSAVTKSSQLNVISHEHPAPYCPSPKPSSYSVLPLNFEDLESSSDPPEKSLSGDEWINSKETSHHHETVSYLDNRHCNTQSDFSNKTRDSPTDSSLCVLSPRRISQNGNSHNTSIMGSGLDRNQKRSNYNSVESGTTRDDQIRKYGHVYNAFSVGNKENNHRHSDIDYKEIQYEITHPHSSSVSVRSGQCETTKNITEEPLPRQNSAPILNEDADTSKVVSLSQFSTNSKAQSVDDSAQTSKTVNTSEHALPTADIFCVQTEENTRTKSLLDLENSTRNMKEEPNFGAEHARGVRNTNKQTTTVSLESIVSEVYKHKLPNKNNPLQPASGQAQNSKHCNNSSNKPSQNLSEQTKQTAKGRLTKTKTTLEAAVSRTAFLLTFTFIISYLPYFFVSIPRAISPDADFHLDAARVNLINLSSRLFYISPSINPIIFWASNLDFRRHCKCLCSKDSLTSVA